VQIQQSAVSEARGHSNHLRQIGTVSELRSASRSARCEGRRIALVPTMGALHEGHLALVREARSRADLVIASIFVNPTQFGPNEDFDQYPRPLSDDLRLLAEAGTNIAFTPSVHEMYPHGDLANPQLRLSAGRLAHNLCGRHRPGHFDGVMQVVTRLFNIAEPDVAVFGRKDAQQFVIIQQLTDALAFDIEIVGVETIREPDGLAMSSRNRYLSVDERTKALAISRAISRMRKAIEKREQDGNALVTAALNEMAAAPELDVQYVEVVDASTLQLIRRIEPGQEVLVAVAAHIGGTRLIDSAFVVAPRQPTRIVSD
jgi:pantoate--beta-alanine ligase